MKAEQLAMAQSMYRACCRACCKVCRVGGQPDIVSHCIVREAVVNCCNAVYRLETLIMASLLWGSPLKTLS